MADLPTGTVTFLFTDIEGSTRLAQQHAVAWEAVRQRHHAILRAAFEPHGGYVFQVIGDAFCVAFATAPEALAAAIDAQRALQAEPWGDTPIRVRMGLHTGAAEFRDVEYHGYLTLAHVQRVMSTAHGGQTLVSNATGALLSGQLPDGVALRDMGEHRLKELADLERILQVIAPDLRSDFPPLKSLSSVPNNLPVQLTSFIGRRNEIAEILRLLTTTRLLTLTGSGGTGKTRLSLEIASGLLDQFRDGVWLVELAPLADSTFIPQTVALALGVSEQPGRPIMLTLQEHLHDRQLLLVLDNCEHLIEACARLADSFLRSAPHLKIMTSSREALGIAGETTYRVPSLPIPDPYYRERLASAFEPTTEPADPSTIINLMRYDAVRLFVSRAEAAKSGFRLSDANAPAVAQICRRLDGIPLAIELAAARIQVFAAEQIADRLDDRFRLLTGGSRTAMPRQQTLRALIDWSFSLLAESEKILLRRLSVFAGGWSFEAAEAVCADGTLAVSDVLDALTRLVEKSLVGEEEKDGVARYRMLESIRQYAREKLLDSGEGEQLRARHLGFYVDFAERFHTDYLSGPMPLGFGPLETENDNIRAAIEWSLESEDAASGMRLVRALRRFWQQRFPIEGLAYMRAILDRPEAHNHGEARALALSAKGSLEYWQGDYVSAQKSHEEALRIASAVGATDTVAAATYFLGQTATALKDYAAARALLSDALESFRTLADPLRVAMCLLNLGDIALSTDDIRTAQALYEESFAELKFLGMNGNMALASRRLGQIAGTLGDDQRATSCIRASLTLNLEMGDKRGVAASLAAWACRLTARERAVEAIRLFGAVDAILVSMRTQLLPLDRDPYERTLAALRAQLEPAAFDAAWSAGRALTLEQAIALALKDGAE